ncbi:hypothetical protein AB9J70_17900 [Elizabethkingia anophelis]|uniref:hypothetical protein n=1 Tax=Elizabethkingia anophelis TaxID=1117645 RepID=UPI0035566FA6
MKKLLSLILFLFIILANAQEKNYYEFGWKEKYGIVDQNGNEIVAPVYQWSVYTLNENSDFIALNSHEDGGLIVNTKTGKMQKFDYMDDTYLINIGDKEFFYAYDKNGSYLLNTLDLDKKITLPKQYYDIKQEGNYLFCYLNNMSADILSKADRKIVKGNFPMTKNSSYQTTNDEIIYAIEQKKGTLFLDKNLKQIANTPKLLNDFEQVQHFLLTKNILLKQINPFDTAESFSPIGKGKDYPRVDVGMSGSFLQCDIYYSQQDVQPFFKFKKKNYKLYNYGPSKNMLRLATEEGNKIIMQYLFHFNILTKTVLLPEKYWNGIDLHLIK